MEANGHVPDLCLVGEPTSEHRLGEVVKSGRRGSVNVWITVPGIRGHVAYPHLADNPITPLVRLLNTLKARVLDEGSDWFAPSNLEVTRSEEHTSELQSLMRISYAVFCLKKKTTYVHNNSRKPAINS